MSNLLREQSVSTKAFMQDPTSCDLLTEQIVSTTAFMQVTVS